MGDILYLEAKPSKCLLSSMRISGIITPSIPEFLHNLIKFTIQLNRPNTICSYKTIDFADLYALLDYKKSDKQILSISILARDDYILKEMLSELSPKSESYSHKPIHLGTITTKDFSLYLVGIAVKKRYQNLHNYLIKISTGKIILLDATNYDCLEQLAHIEDIIFDQHNKEHTLVLLKNSRTPEKLKEKVRIQFLKEEDTKILIKEYDVLDKYFIFDIIKKVMYSFLPTKS